MSTITFGLDLGDRISRYCELDAAGVVLAEGRLSTTPAGLRQHFAGRTPCRIVCEVGTHSPWVSRLLASCGHEVLVANARQVRLIYAGDRKSDRIDAETLARLGRLDPRLLRPIQHRGAEAQAALAQLRARDALVRIRTVLINHVRGAGKSTGQRARGGKHAKKRAVIATARRLAVLPHRLWVSGAVYEPERQAA